MSRQKFSTSSSTTCRVISGPLAASCSRCSLERRLPVFCRQTPKKSSRRNSPPVSSTLTIPKSTLPFLLKPNRFLNAFSVLTANLDQQRSKVSEIHYIPIELNCFFKVLEDEWIKNCKKLPSKNIAALESPVDISKGVSSAIKVVTNSSRNSSKQGGISLQAPVSSGNPSKTTSNQGEKWRVLCLGSRARAKKTSQGVWEVAPLSQKTL